MSGVNDRGRPSSTVRRTSASRLFGTMTSICDSSDCLSWCRGTLTVVPCAPSEHAFRRDGSSWTNRQPYPKERLSISSQTTRAMIFPQRSGRHSTTPWRRRGNRQSPGGAGLHLKSSISCASVGESAGRIDRVVRHHWSHATSRSSLSPHLRGDVSKSSSWSRIRHFTCSTEVSLRIHTGLVAVIRNHTRYSSPSPRIPAPDAPSAAVLSAKGATPSASGDMDRACGCTDPVVQGSDPVVRGSDPAVQGSDPASAGSDPASRRADRASLDTDPVDLVAA
jgi:hypothetical protein